MNWITTSSIVRSNGEYHSDQCDNTSTHYLSRMNVEIPVPNSFSLKGGLIEENQADDVEGETYIWITGSLVYYKYHDNADNEVKSIR